MQKTFQDTSDKVLKIAKQIKKEHFIKLFLWIVTTLWIIIFLFILLFSTIPFDDGNFIAGLRLVRPLDEFGVPIPDLPPIYIQDPVDSNALYVFNMQRNSIVVWINVSLTSGWLTFLVFLSIYKNMITPSQLKRTLRKSITFDYLKQEQVDRTIYDIDVNIGVIKAREENEEEE